MFCKTKLVTLKWVFVRVYNFVYCENIFIISYRQTWVVSTFNNKFKFCLSKSILHEVLFTNCIKVQEESCFTVFINESSGKCGAFLNYVVHCFLFNNFWDFLSSCKCSVSIIIVIISELNSESNWLGLRADWVT